MKNIKDLSEGSTQNIAVATAVQPITDNNSNQLALPNKKNSE